MKTTNLLMMLFSFVLISCKTENKKNNLENQFNEKNEQAVGKSADEWAGKLNELLTLDIATSVSKYSASEAKEEYSQILKNPATHSIMYQWEKGREITINNPVLGKDMRIPTDDLIELSWVKSTTLKEFKANYHTPTEQELANANIAVDKKLNEMQDENKINEKQSKTAKNMATSFAEGLSFDEIQDVGDYAVWNNKIKVLKVFHKGLEFQIRTVLSDDEAVNRQKSIEVAQKIIKNKL